MFIKHVIIDGFKSYANRTVVADFDAEFNAITGLNGSGKSNILDAICFVLGISQLSHVRVSNLQGLVYKQGQSGVTKASVTIVFDNSDEERSPVGFEQDKEITVTRQVAIGGRNKYLINGKNAQAKQVHDLFHSVQLNVNNPHFLIMQGRITKVLNMKPPEILGMIEEAAGTKMFESKKLDAEKKMEQKQVKVNEIEKILAEEITPKLERLRTEKQGYLKWAAQNQELERLQRFVLAYNFTEKSNIVRDGERNQEQLLAQVTSLEEEMEQAKDRLEELKAERSDLDSSLLKALEKDIERLAAKEEELSKKLVKQTSVLKNKQAAFAKVSKKKEKMLSQKESFASQLEALQATAASKKEELDSAKEVYQGAKRDVENAQIAMQAAKAGLDNDSSQPETQQLTMEEKLVNLRSSVDEASTLIKQNQMKIKHTEKELASVTKQLSQTASKDKKSSQELERQVNAVASLESELAKIDYDPKQAQALREELETKQDQLTEVRDATEALSAKLAAFEFDYADPFPGFDRSSVKGMVAKLVDVPDLNNATALEVVAGGKLFQVVVDRVETGKALLEKGKLKKRVTIIPLDKVSSRVVPEEKLRAAQEIAEEKGGSAKSALSLVGFDDELEKAMAYVFGTTLVCDSLLTARSVTFNKRVQVKSVTLEGDAFDPQGTLSGGSRPNRGAVLVQLAKLQTAQNKMEALERQVKELSGTLERLDANASSFESLRQKLTLAQHELDLIQQRAKNTPLAQLQSKQADLQSTLETLTAQQIEIKAKKENAMEQVKEMEEEMKDMEAARSKLVDKAQARLTEAKANLTTAEEGLGKTREAFESAELQVEQLVQERDSIDESIHASDTELADMQKELDELEVKAKRCKDAYDQARLETEEKREELRECQEKVASISKAGAELASKVQKCELKIKERQGEIHRMKKQCVDAAKEAKAMLAKYPWIQEERQFFGKPHTDYDFEVRSPENAMKRLAELEESQSKTSNSINKKVMGMIGKAEEEYKDLQEKRTIIEKDRATIERVIKGLEQKKNEAIQSTWQKVNKDFGSIFSTLLPGTQAKLEPPEDGTILDGLEVKVAFGNTWKKSLTELSGGQRSLLALSLILSMLLLSPAPFYIFDEIDAALDLSHTQNIGQMLRTHFAHSQFIVVSLKEGMFNNANVIFRTKFIDGLSTVTRHTNRPKKDKAEEDAGQGGKKAKKRVRDENVRVN